MLKKNIFIIFFISLHPIYYHINITNMQVAIIGAGAAGCFAAINLKRMNPSVDVTIYESGKHSLAKVALTGGGRCNLTNSFSDVTNLASVFPRGERLMKRLLHEFSHVDLYDWFEREGVRLITQEDNCVFPESQDAIEVVSTLIRLMRREDVRIKTQHRVTKIQEGFTISFEDKPDSHADIVLVTTGGIPKKEGFDFLSSFNLEIIDPLPSLFSICLPKDNIIELMGTVVNDVSVGLVGTRLRATGPLLITHWGMSGPAILKLSSYAARILYECDYKAQISVNWFGEKSEAEVLQNIISIANENPQKMLLNYRPVHLNNRLWLYLLQKSGINPEQRWAELSKKSYNRLVSTFTNNIYDVEGKNRFKDEFVTCGGVSLTNITPRTLECKTIPGLYFAGEILDIDAITGGFNLQAAWTTGYVAAKAIASKT